MTGIAASDPESTHPAKVTIDLGSDVRSALVEPGAILSTAVIQSGLPVEQPCAGRGTCLKCKVIAEGDLTALDEHERKGLTRAEQAAHYRLACRARVLGDATVTLAPIVVYSNKIFHVSDDYKRKDAPLGIAIDLGSTTVAAFVTTLDAGRVCAGAAALNQQTTFGADVISRLDAALYGHEADERLSTLALSSIIQAVDALHLTPAAHKRIRKAIIVGNCAMHHLLLRLPVMTLGAIPFQPYRKSATRFSSGAGDDSASTGTGSLIAGLFPAGAEVWMPPLIGGFVGSDALACLLNYDFDRATRPMAAIDLGTNGEVLITDGKRILVASTAAGPAFEGVNISSGVRALDGAITGATLGEYDGSVTLRTIADAPPVGLTGSGLLELVSELRRTGVLDETGKFAAGHPVFGDRLGRDPAGVRRFLITDDGRDRHSAGEDGEGTRVSLYLTQHDVRELQKAKGAIKAAMQTLLTQLQLEPGDLARVILTGSFGSQLDAGAVLSLGMLPPVPAGVVESSPNGAGFGAALMLDPSQFERAERIASVAEQVDLDLDPDFDRRYLQSLGLTAG